MSPTGFRKRASKRQCNDIRAGVIALLYRLEESQSIPQRDTAATAPTLLATQSQECMSRWLWCFVWWGTGTKVVNHRSPTRSLAISHEQCYEHLENWGQRVQALERETEINRQDSSLAFDSPSALLSFVSSSLLAVWCQNERATTQSRTWCSNRRGRRRNH